MALDVVPSHVKVLEREVVILHHAGHVRLEASILLVLPPKNGSLLEATLVESVPHSFNVL